MKKRLELGNRFGDGFKMNAENNLEDLLNQYKAPVIVGIVGLVLLVGGVISSGIIPKTFVKSSKQIPVTIQPQVPAQTQTVKVDVSGAVSSPGVYSLPNEARIEDALKVAGGVTVAADPDYLAKNVNLAQKVVDGMKIYVPVAGEAMSAVSGVSATSAVPGLININTASLADLDKLPQVGAVTAQKIIDGRPYSGLEELVTKKVISRTLYEKIKTQVGI